MQIITCFSYKGGAGRTVAAANIAAALASKNKGVAVQEPLDFKVAFFDLDVFSAGAHRVFGIPGGLLNKQTVPCLQDYLMEQVEPSDHVKAGALTVEHELMRNFRDFHGGGEFCRPDFSFYPSRPSPDDRFLVAKYHENLLVELIEELDSLGFEFLIIDGEAGTRSMADIALRLADIVLMFFRLTWQHVEGTVNVAEELLGKHSNKSVYLIPTCVPEVKDESLVYKEDAPGWEELKERTKDIPKESRLLEFAQEASQSRLARAGEVAVPGPGHFLLHGYIVHDSLILRGEERVVVFNRRHKEPEVARDYYVIARELSCIHQS